MSATRLGRLARRSTIAAGATISILSTFVVVPGLLVTATAASVGPSITYSGSDVCPEGTIAVVKIDANGTVEYKNGQAASDESVTKTTSKNWTWNSPNRNVYAVMVKGGSSQNQGGLYIKTYAYSPSVRTGVVDSDGLLNNGNQTPDISRITLCGTLSDQGDSPYKLTVVSRVCPDFADVQANSSRNNLQETYAPLGGDSPYPGAYPVKPSTEDAGNPKCSPMPEDWTFTLGKGLTSGNPGNLSVVTDKFRTVTTQATTPELDTSGNPVGTKQVLRAKTVTLTADELAKAKTGSGLAIQGGVPSPRTDNAGQLNDLQDKYAFAALRCAIDARNGDNVEWITYPKNSRHVFCYAYYVPRVEKGTITISKVTAPSGSKESFHFSAPRVSYTPNEDFSLTDGQSITFVREVTSSKNKPYVITENDLPTGWTLAGIDCKVDGKSSVVKNIGAGSVTITLAKNDTVSCTYTNSQAGKIVVHKTAANGDDVQFPFTVGGTAASINGNSSKTFTFNGLSKNDSKTVTENVGSLPEGWSLTADPYCTKTDDPDGAVVAQGDAATGTVTPTLRPGQTIHCWYTNRFNENDLGTGTVTIVKQVVGAEAAEDLFGFKVIADDFFGSGQTTLAEPTLPHQGGLTTDVLVKTRTAGRSVTVSEGANPAGWKLTAASCVLEQSNEQTDRLVALDAVATITNPSTITVKPGEHWICTYVNEKDTATLVIHKAVTTGSDATGVDFGFDWNADKAAGSASIAGAGMTSAIVIPVDGSTTVSVQEHSNLSAWTLVGAYCTLNGDKAAFKAAFPLADESAAAPSVTGVGAGDKVDCYFTNNQIPLIPDTTKTTVTADPECVNSTPYVNYTVTGQASEATLQYAWITVDGKIVASGNLSAAAGKLLWPGAKVDSSGAPIAWPGWSQDSDGNWVQVSTDLLPTMKLKINVVAPAAAAKSAAKVVGTSTTGIVTVVLTYPSPCSPPDSSNAPLPHTGGNPAPLIVGGAAGLLLGIALMALGAYRPRRIELHEGE